MKKNLIFCLSLFLIAVIIHGCTPERIDDRREARRAAFEPIRPEKPYRLLPDHPAHLSNKKNPPPAPAEVAKLLVEPPLIWKSASLENAGLEATTSRFHDQTAEVYVIAHRPVNGTLRAIAKNREGQEVARADAPITYQQEQAGFISFALPGKFAPGEITLIHVEYVR